jgi:hypothetical protein
MFLAIIQIYIIERSIGLKSTADCSDFLDNLLDVPLHKQAEKEAVVKGERTVKVQSNLKLLLGPTHLFASQRKARYSCRHLKKGLS